MSRARLATVFLALLATVAGARADEAGPERTAEASRPEPAAAGWRFYTNQRLYPPGGERRSPSLPAHSRPPVSPVAGSPESSSPPSARTRTRVIPRSANDSGIHVPAAPLPGSLHRSRGALPRGSLSGRGRAGSRGR